MNVRCANKKKDHMSSIDYTCLNSGVDLGIQELASGQYKVQSTRQGDKQVN